VDVLFSEVNSTSVTYNLISVTDANTCTRTGSPLSSVTVNISPSPAGTIAATPSSVCEGSNVNLTFSVTAGAGPFSLVVNGTTYPNISSGIQQALQHIHQPFQISGLLMEVHKM
jgi:hypothetical protein